MSNHYPMKPRFEKIGIHTKWVRIADHAFPKQFVGRRFVVVNPGKVGLDKFLFID